MNLQDKRILVTGGSGFLGRHLVAKLRAMRCSVIAPPSEYLDLMNAGLTCEYVHRSKPGVVFHLAARCGGIGANMRDPLGFFQSNMYMGMSITNACVGENVKVVLVGTVCSYPKHTPTPFRESDLWNGYPEETNAPYGIAKKALLTMAQAYRQQYGLNSIYLIPANLYGPGDNFDPQTSHVIPALIRKFIEAKESGKQSVTLWGDGTATREFLYVEDCADALIAAAELYDGAEPVNVGTGREISIDALALGIARDLGYTGLIEYDESKPNGQPRRVLDCSRALREFGWQAKTPMGTGMDRTIAWYMDQRKVAAA
jgi:GDP-L-fucose synthase